MKRYRVTETRLLNSNTLLLTLQPRKQRDQLEFSAGQYAAIGFRRHGRPSPMRCFSIVSSPNNPNELQFAMRVQGDFTKSMANLKVGAKVFVRGPFGDFVIDEPDNRNVIMLAGGIGVTPFMSMIRDATQSQRTNRYTLLYSNPAQDNIAFHDELQDLERQNPRFHAAFFVTRGAIDKLQGSRALSGRIDEARLNQLTGERYDRFSYYICGPKNFIDSMRTILEAHGTAAHHIITEEFTPTNRLSAMLAPPDRASRMTYALTAGSLVLSAAFIMTLDLARVVPKLASVQAPLTSSASQSQTAPASSPAANPTPSSAVSPASPPVAAYTPPSSYSTPTPTAAPQQPVSQPTPTTYQPPVTSVS